MNRKAKLVFRILLSAFLTGFLYIILHETGHMIVMLYADATITEFSIISAHISATGGNYTNFSDLWLNANGALLPLLVSYVYLLFYRKSSRSDFYRIISWMVCLIPISSLLAWVVIPFVYLCGNAPLNDDVTKFLSNFSSAYHPLFVSAGATILIGISIALIIKKQILKNFIEVIKFSKEDGEDHRLCREKRL